jgi:hypothetical protein
VTATSWSIVRPALITSDRPSNRRPGRFRRRPPLRLLQLHGPTTMLRWNRSGIRVWQWPCRAAPNRLRATTDQKTGASSPSEHLRARWTAEWILVTFRASPASRGETIERRQCARSVLPAQVGRRRWWPLAAATSVALFVVPSFYWRQRVCSATSMVKESPRRVDDLALPRLDFVQDHDQYASRARRSEAPDPTGSLEIGHRPSHRRPVPAEPPSEGPVAHPHHPSAAPWSCRKHLEEVGTILRRSADPTIEFAHGRTIGEFCAHSNLSAVGRVHAGRASTMEDLTNLRKPPTGRTSSAPL